MFGATLGKLPCDAQGRLLVGHRGLCCFVAWYEEVLFIAELLGCVIGRVIVMYIRRFWFSETTVCR